MRDIETLSHPIGEGGCAAAGWGFYAIEVKDPTPIASRSTLP